MDRKHVACTGARFQKQICFETESFYRPVFSSDPWAIEREISQIHGYKNVDQRS